MRDPGGGWLHHRTDVGDNHEKTTKFYEEVFGFWEAETRKTRDHLSRHLTDGTIDFTLIKYDAGTQSAESKAKARRR